MPSKEQIIEDVPPHFYYGALEVDYTSAIRANIEKQNYSVCARIWYLDATFRCRDCGCKFLWSKKEQKAWFEDYYFWVDSLPKCCRRCGEALRELKEYRKEYDSLVSKARKGTDLPTKKRVLELLEKLEEGTQLPEKMLQTKTQLKKQIQKTEGGTSTNPDKPNS